MQLKLALNERHDGSISQIMSILNEECKKSCDLSALAADRRVQYQTVSYCCLQVKGQPYEQM